MGKRRSSSESEGPKAKPLSVPMPLDPYTVEGPGLAELCSSGVELDAGIDEAGRGPVLGPMVYGLGLVRCDKAAELKALGVDDSKALTEERRGEIFGRMREEAGEVREWLGYALRVLPPSSIARGMLGRTKESLNQMSFDAAIGLVRHALALGANVKRLFVDTVGPPEPYQARLERLFPGLEIRVTKKADSLFPVVSAASIAAKVSRDEAMVEWRDKEEGLPVLERGSGYPADPKTKAYIAGACDGVFGYPALVRHSWATAQDGTGKRAAAVRWEDDDDQQGTAKSKKLSSFIGSNGAPPPPTQHAYFRDRLLRPVASL